jgi:Protein of unknown function (DUF3618)
VNDNNREASTGPNTEDPTVDTDPTEPSEVDALEADIARTRQDLAHTVDQLAAKLDFKSRIRNRVAETREAATAQAQTARTYLVGVDGKPRPAAMSVGGGILAALAAVVLVRLWMRPSRRHSHGRWRWR